MALNTEISLRNSDPILHNIQFFEGDNSLFNIAQPVQGQVNKKKIEKAGTIYVECAVHGWMQGNVVVVDNPYYAVTDENGKFSITDLLPGKYQVKIWHEYLGESTREITVGAKAETTLDADLKAACGLIDAATVKVKALVGLDIHAVLTDESGVELTLDAVVALVSAVVDVVFKALLQVQVVVSDCSQLLTVLCAVV